MVAVTFRPITRGMHIQAQQKPHTRLGCSTISLRHLVLDEALAQITGLGFETIDLGALPGVCDHLPYVLDARAVNTVAAAVTAVGPAGALDQRRHR